MQRKMNEIPIDLPGLQSVQTLKRWLLVRLSKRLKHFAQVCEVKYSSVKLM